MVVCVAGTVVVVVVVGAAVVGVVDAGAPVVRQSTRPSMLVSGPRSLRHPPVPTIRPWGRTRDRSSAQTPTRRALSTRNHPPRTGLQMMRARPTVFLAPNQPHRQRLAAGVGAPSSRSAPWEWEVANAPPAGDSATRALRCCSATSAVHGALVARQLLRQLGEGLVVEDGRNAVVVVVLAK